MTLPDEVMQRIMYDVAGNVSLQDSKLNYTSEMLAFRGHVEAEFKVWTARHPDAVLDVPVSIDGLP